MGAGAATQERHSTLPVSARDSSPALLIPPGATQCFFTRLEALPRDVCGALVLSRDGEQVGAVLMEHGRVCWAMAHAMRRRLTDLLCHQTTPPLDEQVVRSVYRECVDNHQPLGETLVRRAIVSETGLRRALRQHNAEAIALLSVPESEAVWTPKRSATYDSRFTFGTTELLVSVGALADAESASRARQVLRGVTPPDGTGAAYVALGGDPIPVAEVNSTRFGAADFMDLGRWLSSTHLTTSKALGRPRVTQCRLGKDSLVGWFEGHLGYVVCCTNTAAGRVMSQALRQEAADGDL